MKKAVIGLCVLLIGCGALIAILVSRHAPASKPPSNRIPYRVVEQWSIPAGGYGRVIVIDPAHRNEPDIRTLGATLSYETRNQRYAFISIFDDEKAAAMRQRAMDLKEEDGAFYDHHHIAEYFLNKSTGHNAIQFGLQGFADDRPITTIKF